VKAPGESFRVKASGSCTQCGEPVKGWIAFDGGIRVVDTGGFMVFGNGLTCDECLRSHPRDAS
jgi:hypothetical protein